MISLDTNVLIYAISAEDHRGRRAKALALLDRIGVARPILPLQVVGEYLNVARRNVQLDLADALVMIEAIMAVYCCEPTRADDFIGAVEIAARHNLQYFDALIVKVALRAGATLLLSEDMHDGLVIDGLTIVNPFVSANEGVLADWLGSAP